MCWPPSSGQLRRWQRRCSGESLTASGRCICCPFFVAVLFIGAQDTLTLAEDAAFALLNVVEVVLYAWLGRRYVSVSGQIDSTRKLARFVTLLPVLAISLIAALGASIALLIEDTGWADEWRVILVGNGLAAMVLLPALLAWFPVVWSDASYSPANRGAPSAIAAAMVGMLLLASAVLPGVSTAAYTAST